MTYRDRIDNLTGQLRAAKNYALALDTCPITYEIARELDILIDKLNQDVRRAQQLEEKE